MNRRGPECKVICISLTNTDVKNLDERLERLRAKGVHYSKANRSALIRLALARLDEEQLVKELK